MERFVKGDVAVFRFPFSDSSESKKRPALVTANTNDENLILCQITSQRRADPDIIPITSDDFSKGSLKRESFVRPTILYTEKPIPYALACRCRLFWSNSPPWILQPLGWRGVHLV